MLAILAVAFQEAFLRYTALRGGDEVLDGGHMLALLAVAGGFAILACGRMLAVGWASVQTHGSARAPAGQGIGGMRRNVRITRRERRVAHVPARYSARDTSASRVCMTAVPSMRYLCHDLRSPQNSILALTELARADSRMFDECGGMDQIARLANHTLAISENFIFSTLPEDARRRGFGKVDPVRVAERVLEQMTPVARGRGVRLSYHNGVHCNTAVRGVPEFLSRAIQNLLDNAIQASPAGACVALEIALADDAIEIAVHDEAGGIPGIKDGEAPVDLKLILSEKSVRGFGLGLRIASRIASMQDGSLRAISTAGKGSSFILSLPARDIDDRTIATSGNAAGRCDRA